MAMARMNQILQGLKSKDGTTGMKEAEVAIQRPSSAGTKAPMPSKRSRNRTNASKGLLAPVWEWIASRNGQDPRTPSTEHVPSYHARFRVVVPHFWSFDRSQ